MTCQAATGLCKWFMTTFATYT